MQRPTAKRQAELRESCGRQGERTLEARGSGTAQQNVPQNQPSRVHRGAEKLNRRLPGSLHGSELAPLQLGSCGTPDGGRRRVSKGRPGNMTHGAVTQQVELQHTALNGGDVKPKDCLRGIRKMNETRPGGRP